MAGPSSIGPASRPPVRALPAPPRRSGREERPAVSAYRPARPERLKGHLFDRFA